MQLAPVLALGGERLDAGAAAARGLVLSESSEGGVRRAALENRSGATVHPAELGWRKAGPGDFDVPGLKLYVESWQMASPCGVRAWNDEPFVHPRRLARQARIDMPCRALKRFLSALALRKPQRAWMAPIEWLVCTSIRSASASFVSVMSRPTVVF